MSLHQNQKHEKDLDMLASVLHSTGGGKATKAKASRIQNTNEMTQISKAVRKKYNRDFTLDDTDRIINAIEYLTVNYPKILLPVNLVYWMCNPGSHLKGAGTEEVLRFAKKLGSRKVKMLQKYGRSFFVKAGHIRAYVNREEHAAFEAPRAGRNLFNAYRKAEAIKSVVGNVDTLKVSHEFTPEQKTVARDFSKAVASIGQSIKGLLGPSPTPPTK
jgi:hypothetical protein